MGLSLTAAALAGEAAVRILHLGNDPFPQSEIAMFRDRSEELKHKFVLDPEFGIRPPVGTGMYSSTGIFQGPWDPDAKPPRPDGSLPPPPKERLLFAGDSVTRRGKIILALKQLYGDTGYEYLNAGVETFNTEQELLFYRRYNRPLKPSQIILTFHPNDFDVVPVAFLDEQGRLRVYSGNPELAPLNRFLFLHSRLYRIFAGWKISRASGSGNDLPPDRIARVETALLGFRDEAANIGARLTVLVFPPVKSPNGLTPYELAVRSAVLALLEKNHLRYFDLQPPLEEALTLNMPLGDPPGDTWHPGDELARRIAAYLKARNLLEKPQ